MYKRQVLEGSFYDHDGICRAGEFVWRQPGSFHETHSDEGAVLLAIDELSVQYGLRVANVFHAGDGNLHPNVLYDGSQEGMLERAEQLAGEITKLCVRHGGVITGEHGVGIEKINQMCIQFGSQELEQFHALKHAFDPAALLNPGKAVPTLSRCAEFNAMHVHKGQLPFPEIPRF